MTFKVMKERCADCLYGPNPVVRPARVKELISKTHKTDSYFQCHKGTIAGQDICCKGDWDSHQGGQLGRISGRLGQVEFVDDPTKAKADG